MRRTESKGSKQSPNYLGDCFVGISVLSHLNPPRNDELFLLLSEVSSWLLK
jgi:hypothetical protein